MSKTQENLRRDSHRIEREGTRKRVRHRLFLCMADEIDGEHERLIQFLIKAPTEKRATRKARWHLRREWSDEPDERESKETDVVASFFGGEIIIRKLSVRVMTPAEALTHFTRS